MNKASTTWLSSLWKHRLRLHHYCRRSSLNAMRAPTNTTACYSPLSRSFTLIKIVYKWGWDSFLYIRIIYNLFLFNRPELKTDSSLHLARSFAYVVCMKALPRKITKYYSCEKKTKQTKKKKSDVEKDKTKAKSKWLNSKLDRKIQPSRTGVKFHCYQNIYYNKKMRYFSST